MGKGVWHHSWECMTTQMVAFGNTPSMWLTVMIGGTFMGLLW